MRLRPFIINGSMMRRNQRRHKASNEKRNARPASDSQACDGQHDHLQAEVQGQRERPTTNEDL